MQEDFNDEDSPFGQPTPKAPGHTSVSGVRKEQPVKAPEETPPRTTLETPLDTPAGESTHHSTQEAPEHLDLSSGSAFPEVAAVTPVAPKHSSVSLPAPATAAKAQTHPEGEAHHEGEHHEAEEKDTHAKAPKVVKPKKVSPPLETKTKILIGLTALSLMLAVFTGVKHWNNKPHYEPLPKGAKNFKRVTYKSFLFQKDGKWMLFLQKEPKKGSLGLIREIPPNDPLHPDFQKARDKAKRDAEKKDKKANNPDSI